MRPTTWRRSTHALIAVAVLVLVAAVVAVSAMVTGGGSPDAAAIKPPPPAATANPGIVPVSDSAPKPTRDRLAAALAPVLADPNLGKFTGRITDAITGAELWSQGADVPMQPASTNKMLTAAAALLTLDRDARLTTRVFSTDRPGVVVLKGGGDQTLSAAKPGDATWYRDAARISDLAEQVEEAGIHATAVQVDVSEYSGPTMAHGWDPADIDGGDIAPMESVMLDGGRTQPVSVDSTRSKTPALDAGRALAVALGVDPAKVTVVPGAARGGHEIGSVQSPPLIDRLRDMMNFSDNVMAESIGREVAAKLGLPQSFAGAVQAVLRQLEAAEIDTANARLFDSSGLSVDDRLTADTLDEVVNAAAGNDQPKLRPLVELLPIAGGSGTLSNRYLHIDAHRPSAGFLRAKTGSLTGTNSLAGIVTDSSGRVLTFAFISNDAGPTGLIALDNFAAVLRTCGCSA
ncbi:D-alanyl-D-alanine carboxypeptidase/D-alanyl-D-alanine-endopeptidase [Mycolicibacterium moriokaense]|uniref:D-alanyl-D-alanine carboxypeptidase n=1 Tax=Mycolicibacterium moriokaense TaxID=39691 RepID=A0AAD1M503_9MYCO|nr:D-alanyl-D-alanine carboxypeptidase/D-alanyl-D-alanine-endopeptidase [Mycolicibacterium moriokaense]MCV7040167.1 D-alanyl-D-alanine carboxypeptidase/D-alanyl-D-alanine-endopeptidase [Mycolicibacterium moriokaense]ORB20110.1 D-alanyl-D-alanine carboxypeptidase/D-alanyl-D-alanine-endopeptidase [Mycolicibacterium moriokaense]BBX00181.1 D-alanyl-D-alanine carboxypeptidase [Mycolicibacterium moriokaense]